MAETLYVSFADPADAEKAMGALLDHGARREDLTLVAHGTAPAGEQAYSGTDEDEENDMVASATRGISTTTGEDAASGAAKGAGIGVGLGTMAALASLFIPGIGLVTGGGALAAAIAAAAGTTAAGAITGGVLGYLKDQGVPEEVAHHYHRSITSGGALLSIHMPTGDVDRETVERLVEKYRGSDINSYTGLP